MKRRDPPRTHASVLLNSSKLSIWCECPRHTRTRPSGPGKATAAEGGEHVEGVLAGMSPGGSGQSEPGRWIGASFSRIGPGVQASASSSPWRGRGKRARPKRIAAAGPERSAAQSKAVFGRRPNRSQADASTEAVWLKILRASARLEGREESPYLWCGALDCNLLAAAGPRCQRRSRDRRFPWRS